MKRTVLLFAEARQATGADRVEVDLPEPADVATLRRELSRQYPSLASAVERAMFAIDAAYATDATVVPPDQEVALIPPVSGG